MAQSRSSLSLRLQVLVVCVLLGAYLLILLPAPESIDGDALAAVAASWVRSGSPNMDAVAYADAFMPLPMSELGTVGVDGAIYAKKGVTPSLFLAPLVLLSDVLPWLTTRTTLMLFNPLVITVTALLLLRLVARLGYRPRTAVTVALTFGIGTFAFAYAKTLFGEPLAGLLLLIAVMLIYQGRTARSMVGAGAALGLLVGINTIYAVFVPLLALLILWRWRSRETRFALRDVVIYGMPIVALVLLLGLYNAARFGSPLSSGYHFGEGEGFIVPIWAGMYGLFLSPFRGLFWYSPVILLALPGWLMLRRAQNWLAWTILILVVAQALAFASWWSWTGGVVWAPRFLLPVLPLLALALAPLVEAMWTRRLIFIAFASFAALSFLITCLGAFYSYFPYIERYLNTHYAINNWTLVSGYSDEVLFNPLLSPIIGHLAMFVAGYPMQPGWIAAQDWAYLLIPGGLVVVGIGQLFVGLSRRARLALLVVAAALALQLAVVSQSDRATSDAFASTFQPAGTVVAATDVFRNAFLDVKQNVPVVTITAPTSPDDPTIRAVWDYALKQRELLWLVNWFAPADPQNWQERDLWQSAAFVTERPMLNHRALLFDLDPDPAEQAVAWQFGSIALDAYGVAIRPAGVQVLLRWSATAPNKRLTWFAHLLDASGNVVAQQDRQPQGGYAPTETWKAGDSGRRPPVFPDPRRAGCGDLASARRLGRSRHIGADPGDGRAGAGAARSLCGAAAG